ncbi:MAG: SpoIID/LytB domain-containing protein [Plectolyngbya sp. WJT66-NPBG17]|jgi:peptidoglycan hydrolase-like amidase|nr:SpoIID/LytB domain-containing protein [Plectolyngbya sp. WJT66-NPBG17]
MWRKSILERLKHRPWLLVPFLALIPLAGLYLNQRPQTEVESVPISGASQVNAPLASPTPSTLPSPPPQAQKSPTPKPTLTPVDPKKYTKEQAAINERSKAAFAASVGTVDSLIEMQVAIGMGQPTISITASQGATISDANGRSLSQLAAGNPYTVQASGDQMSFGSGQLPGMVMIQPAANGVLYLGDKPYRGRFLLAAQGGRIWVVNYIDLRHYLYSVVASEVSPSWNKEALKAQAVAARSYALTYYFRRAQPLYHMGSDEYFQVYSGMTRESDRSNQAVDQTAGEFVSYRGGIVESLYAASDDIVADAFRGRGMSQLGALKLAEMGYEYRQILARYYPKTGIARIEQDHE